MTIIKPIDLRPDPLDLDVSILPDTISYAEDIRQISPLSLTGRADILEEHGGPKEIIEDIRLRASFSGRFELLCARCLEPGEQDVSGDFDLIFRPTGVDARSGERAISEAETEIGYYEQSGLVLEDVVREQVLLSLPDRSLCKPGCKGLCPHCGQNRNETECNCEAAPADPRWSALAGLAGAIKSKQN